MMVPTINKNSIKYVPDWKNLILRYEAHHSICSDNLQSLYYFLNNLLAQLPVLRAGISIHYKLKIKTKKKNSHIAN